VVEALKTKTKVLQLFINLSLWGSQHSDGDFFTIFSTTAEENASKLRICWKWLLCARNGFKSAERFKKLRRS
jgi:hypothetical protein